MTVNMQKSQGTGRRLTNHSDVGVYREHTTPGDSAQVRPFLVKSTGRAGKVLIHQVENDKSHSLGEYTGGDTQTLDDEVRDVEVGRLG
jgi:hypothetical protein